MDAAQLPDIAEDGHHSQDNICRSATSSVPGQDGTHNPDTGDLGNLAENQTNGTNISNDEDKKETVELTRKQNTQVVSKEDMYPGKKSTDNSKTYDLNSSVSKLNTSDESKKPPIDKKKINPKRKGFCQHMIKELTPNKDLLVLKLLTFFFFGGMYSATSFFTLHMKQLGITIQEIAVITSVLPIPAIIGPVLSGMIADWMERFKLVLIGNTALTIVFGLAITFTPTSVIPLSTTTALNYTGYGIDTKLTCFDKTYRNQWPCEATCGDALPDRSAVRLVCDAAAADSDVTSCFMNTVEAEGKCGYTMSVSAANSSFSQGRNETVLSDECFLACEPPLSEDSMNSTEKFSNSRTFWIYFLIRFLVTFFMNSAFSLMDTSIVAVLGRVGGDYGKQRLVAMLSLATVPFFTSCVMEAYVTETTAADYNMAYYVMALFLLMALVTMTFINLELGKTEKKEQTHFWEDLKRLLNNRNIVVFQLIMFLLGANWGFLESYLFVFLAHLNAPTYMMGLTLTFGCVTGIPVLLVADKVISYLGRDRIFFIGFMAYTVRMFGYSFITNPWYCFIFESLEVFTYQIMWVAAVTSFTILAPTSLLGTMAGITGAVHYNVGRGGGTFIGGFLIGMVGIVWTFRSFGIASFVFAVFYWFWQRKNDTFKPREDATEPTEKEKEELEQFI